MGLLQAEKQIIGSTSPGTRPRVIRRQHCIGCGLVLALEITDKLGFGGEYWWRKGDIWLRERWFGNRVRCSGCGLEGPLPMDKPLSYESMVTNKEAVHNATSSSAVRHKATQTP